MADLWASIVEAFADLSSGVKKASLLAGAAGTLLGIVWRRQFQWFEALTATGAGIGCVLFVAPAAVRVFGYAGVAEYERLASFLCGLAGMYVVDFVFSIARDPWGTLARMRGHKDGGSR